MRLWVERILLSWLDISIHPAWSGITRNLIMVGTFIAAILGTAAALGIVDSPEWLRPWLWLLSAVVGIFFVFTFVAICIERVKSKPEPLAVSFTQAYEIWTVKQLEQDIHGVELPYIRREIKKVPGSLPRPRSERILIIGERGLGKTREAYEFIKDKRLYATILKSKLIAVPKAPSPPLDKVILFVDNLPRFYQGGHERKLEVQESLEEAVAVLEQACDSLCVVCTANPDELAKLPPGWDKSSFWASFDRHHLPRLNERQTAVLVDELAHRYNKILNPEIRERIIEINKDGSLGNLVLFFTQLQDKRDVEASDLHWLRRSMAETWQAIHRHLVADKKIFGRVFETMGVLYQGRVTLHRRLVTDLALRLNVPGELFSQEQLESAIDELIAFDYVRERRGILQCFDVLLETRGDFASALLRLIQMTFSEDAEVQNMVYSSLPGLYAVIRSIWHIDLSRQNRERILKAWVENHYFGGFRELKWDVVERSKKWALPFRKYLRRSAVTQDVLGILGSVLLLALILFGLGWLDRLELLPFGIGFILIGIAMLLCLAILMGFRDIIKCLWMLVTRRHFSESDHQAIEEQFLTRYDHVPQGIAASVHEGSLSTEEKDAMRKWLFQDRFPIRGSRTWFLLSWIAKGWGGRQKYGQRSTIVESRKTGLDRFPIEEHNAVVEVMLFYIRDELVNYGAWLWAEVKGWLLHPRQTLSRIFSVLKGWRIGPLGAYVLILLITCTVLLPLWPRLSSWWMEVVFMSGMMLLLWLLLGLMAALIVLVLLAVLILMIRLAVVTFTLFLARQPQWRQALLDEMRRPVQLVPDRLMQRLSLPSRLQNSRFKRIRSKRNSVSDAIMKGTLAALTLVFILLSLPAILAHSVYEGTLQRLVSDLTSSFVLLLGVFVLWLSGSILRVFRRQPPTQSDWGVIRRYRAEYSKYGDQVGGGSGTG